MTFNQLQDEQRAWVSHNFPGRTWENPYMGMVEELGELSHHLLKQKQNIRGTHAEHEEGIKDSIADIVIFLADFCSARGYDLDSIVTQTWDHVKLRDWSKNPQTGV